MIKNIQFITLSMFVLLTYQNCDSYHGQGKLSEASFGFSVDPLLDEKAKSILKNNCGSCHGAISTGGVGQISDPVHLIQIGLLTPGDPASSRVVAVIEDGSMAPGIPMAVSDLETLKSWILNMEVTSDLPAPIPKIPLGPTFKSLSENIFVPLCIDCHSANGERSQEQFTSYQLAITTGGIVPGKPNDSELYKEILKNSMPRKPYRALTEEEKQAIYDWILAGALDN